MNNSDFRTLLGEPLEKGPGKGSSTVNGSHAPHSLGGRGRPIVPLTPRNVRGIAPGDFRRQLTESNAAQQASKKFKSSAAPKGAKLQSGYTDRALERQSGTSDAIQDDKEARLKALEEQLKLGQIELSTFETQRDAITAGDIRATHLVKGLDRKLLERVRKGEDVLADPPAAASTAPVNGSAQEIGENRDAEFEALEQEEFAPIQHGMVEKKGERAPPASVRAGIKRSRADLLAELKASRQAAKDAAAQSQLGSRFSKIGSQQSNSRVKKDGSGREVLITVDAEGRTKRKVKKPTPTSNRHEEQLANKLPAPSTKEQPLGMVVPTIRQQPTAEEENMDIFEDVGTAYNPLGDEEEAETGGSSDEEQPVTHRPRREVEETSPNAKAPPGKQNYFGERSEQARVSVNPLHDPAVLGALRRAAELESKRSDTGPEVEKEQLTERQRQLLGSSRDRDLDDMDMGFGSSRFDDEDEEGDPMSRKKLSEWKGSIQDEDDGADAKPSGPGKRKRGKRKHQGDKNSAADILKVIAGRKAQP